MQLTRVILTCKVFKNANKMRQYLLPVVIKSKPLHDPEKMPMHITKKEAINLGLLQNLNV